MCLFSSGGSSQNQDETLVVKEVLLTGLQHKDKKPLLAALVDRDLLLYEAFSFTDSSTEGHLSIRFKKVSCKSTKTYRQPHKIIA